MIRTASMRMTKERTWQLVLLPLLVMTVTRFCSAQTGTPPTPADLKSASTSESSDISRSVQAAASPVTKEDYSIGPEDLLAINVWHEPELSRVVPVRPDGKISMPLIGEVQASGHSPRELGNMIATALQAYMAKPEVAVIL